MADSEDQALLQQQYQAMRMDANGLASKISELEQGSIIILSHADCASDIAYSYTFTDHHEHELVLSAMVALEPTRKCFRLVGGVLVERTVAEVHPAVTSNKEKIKSVIESLRCILLYLSEPNRLLILNIVTFHICRGIVYFRIHILAAHTLEQPAARRERAHHP